MQAETGPRVLVDILSSGHLAIFHQHGAVLYSLQYWVGECLSHWGETVHLGFIARQALITHVRSCCVEILEILLFL